MTQRIAVGLTVVNLLLLVGMLAQNRPLSAQGAPGVLRGSGLEIVDVQGRLRAQITMQPAAIINGTSYPETALFRLIDPNARPVVKIEGSVAGSGLFFGGESEPTMVQLGAKGSASLLRLTNRDGRQQLIQP